MKVLVLFLFIHFLAYTMARAEDISSTPGDAVAAKPVDECKELLPQMETEARLSEQKYQSLRQSLPVIQENYLVAFNQMTQLLFQMVQTREEETRRISENRDLLKASLQQFNEQKSDETSKSLQENYLNLTVMLYTGLTEASKTLETMKSQWGQVETARSAYASARSEIDQLDHQKLSLEARMISLKIKCSPEKRY